MSNHKKDQASNSPCLKESTDSLSKKRDLAETVSSKNGGSKDDFFFPMNKKMKLDELQKEAYFNVLLAFNAESSEVSSPRVMIIKELKQELNISHKTHNALEEKLKTDPLVQQQWREVPLDTAVEGSPTKNRLNVNKEDLIAFQEMLNVAPAKLRKEKAKPSSASDDSPIPGWGKATPASLVNSWVSIRPRGQEVYVAYLITDYDAKREMHHLVPVLSKKGLIDPCNWIDLRHIPIEDTVWLGGHPGFPTRTCFLKQGETILHETSTVRQKKEIKEIGKTAGGIPILQRRLNKHEKGKDMQM